MNLLEQTKYLINKTGLRPDKFKGQNFCIDENVIKLMVETAAVSQSDTILEVGPGFGFLTQELLKAAGKVIAVELDQTLVKPLRRLESAYSNLKVVEGNVLQFPISNFQFPLNIQGQNFQKSKQTTNHKPCPERSRGKQSTNYKIVANLPYSITSAFLKKFLTAEHKPTSMTLLLQKEVAERICASPTNMSLLAISVQLYSQPKIVAIINQDSFWPKPQVKSAIIHIDKIREFPFVSNVSENEFWQIVKCGFSAKRKQLHHNLTAGLKLSTPAVKEILVRSHLNPQLRAQELAIGDWANLAEKLVKLLAKQKT